MDKKYAETAQKWSTSDMLGFLKKMKDGRERIGLAGNTLFFCYCQTIQSQDQHQQLALVCQYFATGSYLRHKSKRINIFLKQFCLYKMLLKTSTYEIWWGLFSAMGYGAVVNIYRSRTVYVGLKTIYSAHVCHNNGTFHLVQQWMMCFWRKRGY